MKTQLTYSRSRLHAAQQAQIKAMDAQEKAANEETPSEPPPFKPGSVIRHLQRSVEAAHNALDDLKKELEATKTSAKTYLVRELEEEVKLAYCENQRLSHIRAETGANQKDIAKQLRAAQKRLETGAVLQDTIGRLSEENASLRDKLVAYSQKKRRMDIEATIKKREGDKKAQPVAEVVEQAGKDVRELAADLRRKDDTLTFQKGQQQQALQELRELVEQLQAKVLTLARGGTVQGGKSGDPCRKPSSCIDGRQHGEIYGSPGGDAGIILRALLAAGADLDVEGIKALIGNVSQKLGRPLYIHTDSHATQNFDPRKEFDEAKATEESCIGCGYFKACIYMSGKIDGAGNLQETAKNVLTAFCQLASAGGPVNCVELEGDHAEDDVLVVKSQEMADCEGHRFVYHPLHEEAVGAVVLEALGAAGGLEKTKFSALCKVHWTGAINLLAPGVPHRSQS